MLPTAVGTGPRLPSTTFCISLYMKKDMPHARIFFSRVLLSAFPRTESMIAPKPSKRATKGNSSSSERAVETANSFFASSLVRSCDRAVWKMEGIEMGCGDKPGIVG